MPMKIPFRVVHVSGQDDNHKAVELNNHSPTTTGWQSSRFCLYPQDIVVQLEKRTRLRKIQILSHQYLIATKIEFYVGDVAEDIPVSLQNARYTRLGYVALSDNEKTGYKARELKSVHVDAVGVFVKFVIHKNHINKHNLYNQVGLVAFNVIGEPFGLDSYTHPRIPPDKHLDPVLAGLFNRPDFISPLDDLAFDMYQDPEVGQIIRKLEQKKQEAVLQERYDYAKKLKNAIQDLQKVGEKLGKFEVEKRQAVENEDYDKAKLKKVQMDEYRLQVYAQLEIHDLLEVAGSRHSQPIDFEPSQSVTPTRLPELSPSPRAVFTSHDDRPLPAAKHTANTAQPTSLPLLRVPVATESDARKASTPMETEREQSPVKPRTPPDERPLRGAGRGYPSESEDTEPTLTDEPAGNVTGEPERMTEKDQREASSVIDIFGLPLVSKAYSKTWSFREDALLDVYKQLNELPLDTPKDEARAMMRAAVFLDNKGLKDKVLAVFTASQNLLELILTKFASDHSVGRQDVGFAVEKTLPTLLQRTGDTAVRIRKAAHDFILEESKYGEVRPLNTVPNECTRPFKLTTAPRLAQGRMEIVEHLYKEHGISNKSGLNVDNTLVFCTNALQHNSGDVREAAERIIIGIYKDGFKTETKDQLPPDDDKTRKNVMYKKLFEAFDKIDGKPSADDNKKAKKEAEVAKQKEIEGLQQQLDSLRTAAAAQGKGTAPPPKNKPSNKSQPKASQPKPKQDADDSNIDKTCIFCGKESADFSEEGLDVHYWKECPMLKRCSYCKQVVEIAGLADHLMTECESKDQFKKCPHCQEAVLKTDYDQHVSDKGEQHIAFEAGKNHCPLCHTNFTPGTEEGWKQHLMGKEGCRQNPRRPTNRQNKGGKKPTPGKPSPGRTGAAPTRATKR